ncbi:MAG: cytochrome b/b6 domain-containing protein [Bacteriovoracaceae bacterium]
MKNKVIKHSIVIRILHWPNFIFVSLMIWSGILIYWAYQPYISIPNKLAEFLFIEYRLAQGMAWHFFIMWFYSINGVLYLIYLVLSKEILRILPTFNDLKVAVPYLLYDLGIIKGCPNFSGDYNPMQRIAYTGVLFVGIGSFLTGVAIYKPVQFSFLIELFGGYQPARLFHFLFMLSFIFFLMIHLIQVYRAGIKNFYSMISEKQIEKNEH